jgi:hypothetical protein
VLLLTTNPALGEDRREGSFAALRTTPVVALAQCVHQEIGVIASTGEGIGTNSTLRLVIVVIPSYSERSP